MAWQEFAGFSGGGKGGQGERGGKSDAEDADALAEGITRPTMRFVAVKTDAQQAVLILRQARDLLVRQGP